MSTTVNPLTIETISTLSFEALSTTVGIVVVTLLVVLMAQKELLRVTRRAGSTQRMQALDALIVPLLIAVGMLLLLRLLSLL